MHIVFTWAAILVLMAFIAAGIGFTHIAPAASEAARIVFYLLVALFLLLLGIGFIVVRKVNSFARGFGLRVSMGGLFGMWKWVQLLRKGRTGFRR